VELKITKASMLFRSLIFKIDFTGTDKIKDIFLFSLSTLAPPQTLTCNSPDPQTACQCGSAAYFGDGQD
jgi:hypothetical protein